MEGALMGGAAGLIILLLLGTRFVQGWGGPAIRAFGPLGRGIFHVVLVRLVVMSLLTVVIVSVLPELAASIVTRVLWIFWFPALLLELVIVPAGWTRVAYWTSRWLHPLPGAGANGCVSVWYGARALARHRAPDPALVDWLRDRLEPREDNGVLVVAEGTLAALEGDLDAARAAFEAGGAIGPRFLSRRLRRFCRDWLVADAASRGNWVRVVALGTARRRHRWSYSVGRLAERILARPSARANGRLVMLWLLSPRRLATLPLLRRALATPLAPVGPVALPDRPVVASLAAALGRVAQLAGRGESVTVEEFVAVAAAVDAVRDDERLPVEIQKRLLALGGLSSSEDVLPALLQQVAMRLTAIVERSEMELPAGEPDGLQDFARRRVRNKLLAALESLGQDYERRVEEESSWTAKDPAALAEWRQYATVRALASRALAIDPSCVLLVHRATWPLINFAVTQHQPRERTVLAHSIWAWQHELAVACGNAELVTLLERNMKVAAGAA